MDSRVTSADELELCSLDVRVCIFDDWDSLALRQRGDNCDVKDGERIDTCLDGEAVKFNVLGAKNE